MKSQRYSQGSRGVIAILFAVLCLSLFSCSSGGGGGGNAQGAEVQVEGPTGNSWDQMNWDEGSWQ